MDDGDIVGAGEERSSEYGQVVDLELHACRD